MSPIVWVFRSGSKTALHGMVKNEITLEARIILRQIHDDLKYSVFFLDYSKPSNEKPKGYFKEILSGDLETSYSLLRFPLHGDVGVCIENISNSTAFRIPVKIQYECKKEDQFLYCLYRKEGNNPPILLTRHVNFFEIRENNLAPEKTSWFVTLQLAEVVNPNSTDLNFKQIQTYKDSTIKSTQRRLLDRTKAVQIADFYDVVASDYFSSFWKSRFIPNWHTLLKNP